MATINTAVEHASKLRPDVFDDNCKAAWLNELEGKIWLEVMHKPCFEPYEYPGDGDKELAVKAPYDNIYELYIVAMSDFFSGEMGNYAASSAMFDYAYLEFCKYYIRNNMPPQKKLKIQGVL